MNRSHVPPSATKLTDSNVRHLVAYGLLGPCHRYGPKKVALEAGCRPKTIRRARDEDTTLGLASTLNALDLDPHILDAALAAKGFMIVPMATGGAPDILASAGASVQSTARNRCPASEGGTKETDNELIASEAENDALLSAAIERRAQINAAKLRRANA